MSNCHLAMINTDSIHYTNIYTLLHVQLDTFMYLLSCDIYTVYGQRTKDTALYLYKLKSTHYLHMSFTSYFNLTH